VSPQATPGRQARLDATSAGPVTVHHPDGSIDTAEPYTPRQLAAIERRARKQPRTWNEINSQKGGGTDYGRHR